MIMVSEAIYAMIFSCNKTDFGMNKVIKTIVSLNLEKICMHCFFSWKVFFALVIIIVELRQIIFTFQDTNETIMVYVTLICFR